MFPSVIYKNRFVYTSRRMYLVSMPIVLCFCFFTCWYLTSIYPFLSKMYRFFKFCLSSPKHVSCGSKPALRCDSWLYLSFVSSNDHGEYYQSIFAVFIASDTAFLIFPLQSSAILFFFFIVGDDGYMLHVHGPK